MLIYNEDMCLCIGDIPHNYDHLITIGYMILYEYYIVIIVCVVCVK